MKHINGTERNRGVSFSAIKYARKRAKNACFVSFLFCSTEQTTVKLQWCPQELEMDTERKKEESVGEHNKTYQ